MRGLFVFTALALLAGCASTSNVTPLGDGKYTVGSKVHGGMTSWNEIKAMAVNKGTAYCKQQGKEISGVQIETHGVRGWTPQEAEVTFECK